MKQAIQFTEMEVKSIILGLLEMIEVMEENYYNKKIPFTDEAKKDLKDILMSSHSALKKLSEEFDIDIDGIPDFQPGDEKQFLKS